MERDFEQSFAFFYDPVFIIICLAISVLQIAGMWKAFTKAGQPGWAAIIPIYNTYIMLKIGGKPGWWLLLFLVPIVNIVIIIWMYNMVSKSFGHDAGFTLGLIFLGLIFWPILGFGSSKYLGPFGNPEAFRAHQNKFDFENKQQ
jgi:Family of unknown function (DUF5684)